MTDSNPMLSRKECLSEYRKHKHDAEEVGSLETKLVRTSNANVDFDVDINFDIDTETLFVDNVFVKDDPGEYGNDEFLFVFDDSERKIMETWIK